MWNTFLGSDASQSRGSLNQAKVDSAKQNDIEHRVVRDQDVGRVHLHVPTAPHFSPIKPWDVVATVIVRCSLRTSVGFAQISSEPDLCRPVCRHPRNRRPARVATEIEAMAVSVLVKPTSCVVAIEGAAEPDELVLHERIHRIEDEGTDCSRPTRLFRALRNQRAFSDRHQGSPTGELPDHRADSVRSEPSTGSKKASVFPEPVPAVTATFLPAITLANASR